tara:strand:- start:19 stop:456 length:438 start_codon:yes stop_codon:yes gene_type:complete
MTFSTNQFALSRQKGTLANTQSKENAIAFKIAATVTTLVAPAQYVGLDADGNLVEVATTVQGIGFIQFNAVKGSATGNDVIDVFMDNTVMWMEAGAAIVPGVKVEVAAAQTVITAPTPAVNITVGIALDAAAQAGDLIRVQIKQF